MTKKIKEPVWIMDRNGVGYYIDKGQDIEMSRQYERLQYHKYSAGMRQGDVMEPNEGDMESVIIDHGRKPGNASYHYCLLMEASKEKMNTFAMKQESEEPYYKVLRQSKEMHIVEDLGTNTKNYVIFSSRPEIHVGKILRVSRPCLLMVQQNDKEFTFSIVDPYIGEGYTEERDIVQTRVDIALTGKGWKIINPENNNSVKLKANFRGDQTVSVTCTQAKPVLFRLRLQ